MWGAAVKRDPLVLAVIAAGGVHLRRDAGGGEQRLGIPDLDIVERSPEEGVAADIGVEARETGHDEAPGAVERHRFAVGAAALDIVIDLAVGAARQGDALVQFALQFGDIGGIVSDEAGLILVRGDDDGAAVLAIGAGRVLGERAAQRIGDGDATLVVDKGESASLIIAPFRHARLAP